MNYLLSLTKEEKEILVTSLVVRWSQWHNQDVFELLRRVTDLQPMSTAAVVDAIKHEQLMYEAAGG